MVFESVLVANRGEAACRIISTLKRLGIKAIAVYSDADREAKHVREADVAVHIGEAPAPASYLNVEAMVNGARVTGAQAVHPGYGFLSESDVLARSVLEAGLIWVGPTPEVLMLAGDKVAARRAFEESGFPILPGAGPFDDLRQANRVAGSLGLPLMVKAAMGGGGIGMGVVESEAEVQAALERAANAGERFFGDNRLYLERYIADGRHVEVQILADVDRTIHLHERECSVQRRHQKLIEETPSPALDDRTKTALTDAAVRSMEAIRYRGAGTVECLLDSQGNFFFLEVNARLQVEHPVTEVTTGVDLVEEQLRIAAGGSMSLSSPPGQKGHGIECRIYAEDPDRFLPSPGKIERMALPSDARCDFGYEAGDQVPMFYDPLVGKVVVWGSDRTEAISQMRHALERTEITGIKSNTTTHLRVLADERFVAGSYDTGILANR